MEPYAHLSRVGAMREQARSLARDGSRPNRKRLGASSGLLFLKFANTGDPLRWFVRRAHISSPSLRCHATRFGRSTQPIANPSLSSWGGAGHQASDLKIEEGF